MGRAKPKVVLLFLNQTKSRDQVSPIDICSSIRSFYIPLSATILYPLWSNAPRPNITSVALNHKNSINARQCAHVPRHPRYLSYTSGLSLEDAVPPSDLHLDEDFDKLEERDKSRKGAGAFLNKIKKWFSRENIFSCKYTKRFDLAIKDWLSIFIRTNQEVIILGETFLI